MRSADIPGRRMKPEVSWRWRTARAWVSFLDRKFGDIIALPLGVPVLIILVPDSLPRVAVAIAHVIRERVRWWLR